MAKLPLHLFLTELVGGCQEPPEIVFDNAITHRRRRREKPQVDLLGDSVHSTSSVSSRWDSMPTSKTDKSLGPPSRVTADNTLKIPTRTPSFDMKSGFLARSRRGEGESPPVSPCHTNGTARKDRSLIPPRRNKQNDVTRILDEAMAELISSLNDWFLMAVNIVCWYDFWQQPICLDVRRWSSDLSIFRKWPITPLSYVTLPFSRDNSLWVQIDQSSFIMIIL